LTLKGLETDTLYLVFKHRFQIVIWIALQTIQTRPKQTGILTNDLYSVKRRSPESPIYPENKKRRNLLATFPRKSDTVGHRKISLFQNPLDALSREEEWAL